MPGITLGDTVPNLEVETTHDKFKLHDYFANSWTVLFSHPGDFTPVCTTELGAMAKYSNEFEKRGVKLLGLSCDDIQSHKDWIKDIEAFTPGSKVKYPIIADPNKEIIPQLNMIDPIENGPSRALHIVGPDSKIKLSFLYPSTTGRNMDEVLRALDSLLMASKHKNKIATPVNWKPDEPVVISPALSDEEAKKLFPQGFKTADLPSKKGYLRLADVS
ncbi:unnamed protein product [Arabis nemorensis]|uniref:Peroxiredoxin n=1 Tax=Arabis nemorensis TaxID=586526 RepID=A0A565APF1_9BRAS|nr:unnamed protein product [Arabis nemorensis]